MKPEIIYAMRTVNSLHQSHGGFQWPKDVGATVEAPDWNDRAECGGGLHGLKYGQGDGGLLNWSSDAIWQIVEVDQASGVVDLDGKIKFRRCRLVVIGDRKAATDFLVNLGIIGVVGSTLTGGDGSTLTGGYGSTLTGGDGSTLTGGNRSTLTGGYGSTLTGGYGSTLTGGDGSTLTGGDGSTLTGGDGSTLTGGEKSTIIASRRDDVAGRRRLVIGYIGEDGLKANVKYRLNDDGKFEEVQLRNDGESM